MAERLTEKNKISCFEYDLANFEHKVKEFNDYDAFYAYNMAVRKLGKLEDIMEKYGIESFELLEHIIKKGKVINSVIEDFAKEEYDKMKQDRDTWKRICELACETLKQVMGKPLWIGGNIPTPEVKDSDYFYQQAKTEGNDE